jgi:hypothetical protein
VGNNKILVNHQVPKKPQKKKKKKEKRNQLVNPRELLSLGRVGIG